MWVRVWLLWVLGLHSWAEYSCQHVSDLGERSKVREHAHHGPGRQDTPRKDRPHRRRGPRVRGEDVAPLIIHHPSDVVVRAGSPATLSCRAEGSPAPDIAWLRGGRPLETGGRDGGQLQRPIVLSDGSLFFLSVVAGGPGGGRRSQLSHEGTYACVAQSSAGLAVSRNATLHVTVLEEDFPVQPSDVEVAEGEVAVLHCAPPAGLPEPNVAWRKDGLPIDSADRHYTEVRGKLIVAPVGKNHSGVYVCVASNTAGVRESRAARLSVLAKPVWVLEPEDVSVKVGESAHFHCQVTGDPAPAVLWSRQQGALPNGRYLVSPDQSLQIHYVTSQDTGTYTCTAVNDVGSVSASAQLSVEDTSNSNQKDFHRELSALRVALESVTVMAAASNMSQVQWKLQAVLSQPHYLDGFEVLYRSLLPASSDWAAKKVRLPDFQCQVGPLKRGYKYEFKVRPYAGDLYGRESNTRHLVVPETAPSASPLAVSVAVDREQNNTVHLSWEPPPHQAHNGIIQGYQVWCVDSEEPRCHNWTVDGSRHSLHITTLTPGRRYFVVMAAANGAGLGKQSDPLGFVIEPPRGLSSQSDSESGGVSWVLSWLRDPVMIGSLGALLWFVLMATVICLFRRNAKIGRLGPGCSKVNGLHTLASEDLIIKHRMAAPDSPWISGAWRSAYCQDQGLWAQSHEKARLRCTSLPVSAREEGPANCLGSPVPIVPDDRGAVYGTFYVDLPASGLETFNSPARRPRASGGAPRGQPETLCVSVRPTAKTPIAREPSLPWKHAIHAQPKMGVLRESWEKSHYKEELHAVSSVPLLSDRHAYTRRSSHLATGRQAYGHGDSPRTLHYSASLQLVDALRCPPPIPVDDTTDTHSLTSDEGSSHSTKLTVDLGSLQSQCSASGHQGHPAPPVHGGSAGGPPHCVALDDGHGKGTDYLELCPRAEEHSGPSDQADRSLDCARGPKMAAVAQGAQVTTWGRARPQSTPSSCYSEWDGSLWSSWASVTDGSLASARASLISSAPSEDAFARFLALAGTMSDASFSDFSPPASPLSVLSPSGELEATPAWDWSRAWLEEMEAQYRALYPPAPPFRGGGRPCTLTTAPRPPAPPSRGDWGQEGTPCVEE